MQNGEGSGVTPDSRPIGERPCNQGFSETAVADHSSSTAEARFDHSSFETSDRIEARADRRMVTLLLDLATCSQVRASGTERQPADANALRLPVNTKGKALGDDPVGDIAANYQRASKVRDARKRLALKLVLVKGAERELHATRYARRKAADLGTQEGRLAVARFAVEHGTRRAALAYALDPSDERSVASMQRNVRRYLVELRKAS